MYGLQVLVARICLKKKKWNLNFLTNGIVSLLMQQFLFDTKDHEGNLKNTLS